MPCVMHTAEVGPGWTYSVIEGIIMQLFAAAGWGTPVRVGQSPTDVGRHWYFDPWNGVNPSIDFSTQSNPEPTQISFQTKIGLHKRYHVTGTGQTVVRDENYWYYQASTSGQSGAWTTAVADPMYFFTLSSADLRVFSIYHREAVISGYWLKLRDQPADLWTPDRIATAVAGQNLSTSVDTMRAYGPGGSATPTPNTTNSNFNSAANMYDILPGEYQFTQSPPNPNIPYAGLNKRAVTWNHPVFNSRIFAGYLPHDCAYVAANSLPKWGQVITDSGKRLQLVENSLSNSLGIWITP